MIRIDFDAPSFQRLPRGLCIVSERLQHMLPKDNEMFVSQASEELEQVQINRVFRLAKQPSEAPVASEPEEPPAQVIQGEFIALEDEPHGDFNAEAGDVDVSHQNATELSFAGKPGMSVSGEYHGSDFAFYRFNKKNGRSFFLRIGEHLIWGIELQRELRIVKPQKGQKIRVTFVGKTPVTVPKKIDGEVEWINTFRNTWKIEAI